MTKQEALQLVNEATNLADILRHFIGGIDRFGNTSFVERNRNLVEKALLQYESLLIQLGDEDLA